MPTSTAERFMLDRARFAAWQREQREDLTGLTYHDLGLPGAVASYFRDAIEANAVQAPPGTEVVVYVAGDDSVIVGIREDDLPLRVALPLRQVATFAIEAHRIAFWTDWTDETFEQGCAVIEALLSRADDLLPSFQAMQDGEQRLAAF
jgi:hypothetical protein